MNVFDKQYWTPETGLEALIRIRTSGVVKLTICQAHGVSFSTDDYCSASELPFADCGLAMEHVIITKEQRVKLMITLAELLLERYQKDLLEITVMQKLAQEMISDGK